jgi:hypothetical protein
MSQKAIEIRQSLQKKPTWSSWQRIKQLGQLGAIIGSMQEG